jgi:transcriptional regulator with XRE-family HTH domain
MQGMTLGEIVRTERMRAGVSQRALARRAGTTQAAISRIERGLEEPGFGRFQAIMRSLGLEPSIDLAPISHHREEPRRLLYEMRRGTTPSQYVADGLSLARFAREIRTAAMRR